MIHTKAFFAHIVQSRGPIAMGKNSSGPVKSERVPMSPSEQANRIRRAARALQQGVMQQDLIMRGFKAAEIKQAAQMIGKK
jgi:phosphopantetheinyl transferase